MNEDEKIGLGKLFDAIDHILNDFDRVGEIRDHRFGILEDVGFLKWLEENKDPDLAEMLKALESYQLYLWMHVPLALYHITTILKTLMNQVTELQLKFRFAGYNSYQEYLQSPHWQEVRKRALERAGHRCSVCSRKSDLNVHHNTYENLGRERDEDVTVLCRECHELFYRQGKLAHFDDQ